MTDPLPGPWASAFYVNLRTKLRSKSNYRVGKKGWDALAGFEAVTGAELAAAKPENWDSSTSKTPLPERPIVVIVVVAVSLVDSTNFCKSVADAMQGVLVVNDASIAGSMTLGERSGSNQRCGVAAAQLPPRASLAEQAEALKHLADYALQGFVEIDPED